MSETPQQAARRRAAAAIRDGYKPEALHAYTDAKGNPLHWRIRARHPDTGDKWIRPMKRNGGGYALGEPEYPEGKPLYRLHDLATRPGDPVFVVEGEWAADHLRKLGVLATTSGAADSAAKADWRPLAGRRITIWPDNDEAGRRYAQEVTEKLLTQGCTAQVIDVEALGIRLKADAVDWLAVNPDATAADVLGLACVDAPRRDESSKKDPAIAESDGPIIYRRASEIQARPIRWLWRGRIARGKVSLLAGNPGLGKSQIAASMAAIVTTAGLWPVDRSRCDQGKVIILSAEDDPADTIRPRLEVAGADLSRVFILDAVMEVNRQGVALQKTLNLASDLPNLESLITKIGDVALIVIDPLTAYLGGTDSYKNAEVRGLLAPLSDLAARHGVAIVCVSHLSKSGANEALMRIMGSLAFVAAARPRLW